MLIGTCSNDWVRYTCALTRGDGVAADFTGEPGCPATGAGAPAFALPAGGAPPAGICVFSAWACAFAALRVPSAADTWLMPTAPWIAGATVATAAGAGVAPPSGV